MNIVYIKDLAINCIIGLNDDERINEQKVLLNISLFIDDSSFGKKDNLAGSINYSQLNLEVVEFVKETKSKTVEYLADQLASLCLAKPFVKKVKLSIEKPAAIKNAKAAGVEIERLNQ